MAGIIRDPTAQTAAPRAPWAPSIPPSAADHLGLGPPAQGTDASFAQGLAQLVDERIDARLRGRASDRFHGVADMELVHELIARGWAVYKPREAKVTPDV